jgi:hypothetical protein
MRYALLLFLLLLPASAFPQSGTMVDLGGGFITFSDSSGTTGTIVDLGGGFKSYSDSAGRTGTIVDLGNGFSTYNISPPAGLNQPPTFAPPAFSFGPRDSTPTAQPPLPRLRPGTLDR